MNPGMWLQSGQFSRERICAVQRQSLVRTSLHVLSPTTSSSAGIGGLTDEPISAGEVAHISVFDAPDFSSLPEFRRVEMPEYIGQTK
jgi:hypothetical protein